MKEKMTAEEILEKCSRKYNSEGFNEMLYWQDDNIKKCAIEAMKTYAEQKVKEATEWIIVKDRLPNSNGSYLAALGGITVVLYWQNLSKRFETVYSSVEPSHWMPLPQPPLTT